MVRFSARPAHGSGPVPPNPWRRRIRGRWSFAGGEVRELVAEDLVEEGVSAHGSSDVGGDADEAAVQVAPAEGSGEAAGELDPGFGQQMRDLPDVEPAFKRGSKAAIKFKSSGHGRKGWHGQGWLGGFPFRFSSLTNRPGRRVREVK